jgi:DNA-binding NtrC family response regulator
MCWAFRIILAAEGCTWQVAHTGKEALAARAAGPFDMAFVDLKLPDIEGFEVIARLRLEDPRLPCILVSGYLYPDDPAVQAAMHAGLIVSFIGKPFQLDQIRNVLLPVLSIPRESRESVPS